MLGEEPRIGTRIGEVLQADLAPDALADEGDDVVVAESGADGERHQWSILLTQEQGHSTPQWSMAQLVSHDSEAASSRASS